jgi:hypothetical protein
VDSLQQRLSGKLLAALWFAVFGFLPVAFFFIRPPIASRGLIVFVLLPTIASAIAGFLWGGAILDPSRTGSYPKCLLRGTAVTGGAYVIFAVFFSFGVPLTEGGWTLSHSFGVFLGTLTFGLVMTGPIILVMGMMGAVTLYMFGRRILPERGGRVPQPTE